MGWLNQKVTDSSMAESYLQLRKMACLKKTSVPENTVRVPRVSEIFLHRSLLVNGAQLASRGVDVLHARAAGAHWPKTCIATRKVEALQTPGSLHSMSEGLQRCPAGNSQR